MNALEALCYLTEKQIDGLFRAARQLPEDKLDWKPAPGARSALDQLQEVATAFREFGDMYTTRKAEFDPEKFQRWVESRSKLTTLDELERVCKEQTGELLALIRRTSESALEEPVDLPFPGPWNYLDILAYHYWNATYHEGQINYIASLLESNGTKE